jgi:hypothetical protein
MQHVMRDDVRHRASFGMTIENTNVRVWFCCRGAVIVSEVFDLIQVRVFLFLFCVAMSGFLICCLAIQLGT